MPRRFFKKLSPASEALQNRWYLRAFGARLLGDPRLWSVRRRAVTGAVGAGLAICFVPLPVHLLLGALVGVAFRLNVPAIMLTVFLVNPLTFVPIYYFAYRVGAAMLGRDLEPFRFALSWDWVQQGLATTWQPLLLGCLTCGVLAGFGGWAALELAWRWSAGNRYRARRLRSTD